jgi:transcription termination/antitermination protein NusG
MSENIKKWYVLRAIGGKEKKVKEYIESEINRLNLQDYISQVLIPTEKVYKIRSGKKISKERNFFPDMFLLKQFLPEKFPIYYKIYRMLSVFLAVKEMNLFLYVSRR